MVQRREKYCTCRNACIHDHAWPDARAKQGWVVVERYISSLTVGIIGGFNPCFGRPLLQQTFLSKRKLYQRNPYFGNALRYQKELVLC
jgi:hypothetical protein